MKKGMKVLVICLLMVAAVQVLSAQGSTEAPKPAAEVQAPVVKDYPVVYWTTFTGANGAFIQTIIDEFNASQDAYEVTMQYNGNYMDQLAKLQVSDQKSLPNLINGSTEQVGTYAYSDFIAWAGNVVAKDDPLLNSFYGNLKATWGDSVSGKWIGLPMGNSQSGIMVNMYIAKQAGIDPFSWKSLEDVWRDCYKIVEGKHAEFAIGTDHSSIYMNYALSIEGVPALNNDNGAKALPTKALYTQSPTFEATKRYLEIWQDLSAKKICYPLGSSWGNECLPAFASGQIAFLTGTVGGYGRVESAWNTAHKEDGKKIDVAFIPWLPVTSKGRASGLPASGNGFYLIEKGDPIGQQGAWEFLKFFLSAENQARWCLQTGYLPLNEACRNTVAYQNYVKNRFPYATYILDRQLKSDTRSFYPINMIDTEFKAAGLEALEKVAADPNYSIDRAIKEMTEQINEALDLWHMSNK
jgi:sn-glycerol 3-phosphate transport system substrate-binding protein